ncbi:MAG: azurin [Algibacter sp.]
MKTIKYVLASVFALTILVSCGGEKKKEEKKPEKVKLGVKKEVKQVENEIAEIVISGDDLMKFDKSEIKVKAGQKVKITLRHKGKLDLNVMGHNFVLLKKGTSIAAFARKAAVSKDNQYIPKDTQDVIAHTGLVGAGQTTSVEFVAPEAGTYDFLCSFPGHYAMMKGKFIVE